MKFKSVIQSLGFQKSEADVIAGFGRSKNARQLLGRAVRHPRIFFRHFMDHNSKIVITGRLVVEIKKEFGTADTKYSRSFVQLRHESVPFINEKLNEAERLLAGSKP